MSGIYSLSYNKRSFSHFGKESFTLIELLIVIAILAILAIAVILVLNPAELLTETRDATRLSDMDVLNHGILLYEEDVGGSLGAASTTYISIPDPIATSTAGDQCQGLGLPTSTAFTWHCAASSTYLDVNGTGWIPIDFTKISFNNPFGSLPTDPTNTTSSGLYYTYTPGGSYELTAVMESSKYQTKAASDGGTDPAQYEVGSDLSLSPYAHGLVGEWKFDDANGGLGSATNDASGLGHSGTLSDTSSTGSGPTYQSSGCIEGGCLSFDGTDDYVDISSNEFHFGPSNSFTVSLWFKDAGTLSPYEGGMLFQQANCNNFQYGMTATNGHVEFDVGKTCVHEDGYGSSETPGQWYFATGVYTNSTVYFYLNGALVGSQAYTYGVIPNSDTTTIIGCDGCSSQREFHGLIDDVSIYNRALSASEISAIYNAEKS